MSLEKKFFDVECANGRAYDLKELRRILTKVFGKRVDRIRVFRARQPVAGEIARVVIELHENTMLYFEDIQEKDLDDYCIQLLEVAADGSAKSLHKPAEPTAPETIPISIQIVPLASSHPASSLSLRATAA